MTCILLILCIFCFFTISNVYATNDNSTGKLTTDNTDNISILYENIDMNNSRTDTFLNTSDVIKYYGGSERYGIYLYDNESNPLAEKSVSIFINGLEIHRSTNNIGYTSIPIILQPGNYSVSCFFSGDDEYKPCNSSGWVFINSTIHGDDLTKYFRNSSQYYCLFFCVDGVALANTTVTFNINGVMYNRTTNSSGWARLNINLLPGNYIITAINPVNHEMHYNNITVLPIIVDNKNLVKYYRNASQYVVLILGPTGNPVGSGENVTFNINGVFYTRHTNSSGHAKLNINLEPGNYVLTVEYNNFRVSNNITVLSILVSEDLHMGYMDGSYFEVIVLDSQGNPHKNQTVTFNINGVFYTRHTGNDGAARLRINLMSSPEPYIITSYCNNLVISNHIYIGDSYSSSKSYFIECYNYTRYYGRPDYFYAYLKDGQGNYIANKSILLECGDFSSARLTDSYGCVRWLIDWNAGSYNIFLSFRSNHPNDIVNNVNKNINILKTQTYLNNNSPLTVNYTDFIRCSVRLTDRFNNPLAEQIISFEILNDTYYNITDNNGVAYYYFNLDVGNYSISANFNQDSNYYSSSVNNSLYVLGYDVDVFIDKSNVFYNVSCLNITISSNILDSVIFYSFDNSTWHNKKSSVLLTLPRGTWDLYYYSSFLIFNTSVKHTLFKINDNAPIVFPNYPSDIYSSPLYVNLSFFDYCDDNISIYYTLDGSNPDNNSLIFNNSIYIYNNTCLKFYGMNSNGMCSDIVSVNYLFGRIANLNSAKTFDTIQEAIDDNQTHDGDVICVNNRGYYYGGVNITKFIKLIGKNSPLILLGYNDYFNVNSCNVSIIGFKFQNNDKSICLNNISGCVIKDNVFARSFNSIVINNSYNCIIKNNHIYFNDNYNTINIKGIVILNSSNLIINDNYIDFNYSILDNRSSTGIDFDYSNSSNVFIFNNTIIANNQNCGLRISGFNITVYNNSVSGFYMGIYSNLVDSDIFYNNIINNQIGLYFDSINTSFNGNNIYGNNIGVIQNRTINSGFYLNRVSNIIYNFYQIQIT